MWLIVIPLLYLFACFAHKHKVAPPHTKAFQLRISEQDNPNLACSSQPVNHKQLSQIRILEIIVISNEVVYGKTIDSSLWALLLSPLTSATIIAQQAPPCKSPQHFRAGEADDFSSANNKITSEWIDGLAHIARIMVECAVYAHDDEKAERRAVWDDCFGERYQKCKTFYGDRIFRKGDFKSGPCEWDSMKDDYGT
jgi:hypothetical protein